MRIASCHIDQFGTLEERTFADLDHELVVLLGPNEAGKSTFFEFLKTMLFGFSPANAGKHPYRPDDGRLSGRMSFVAGRTACSVERSLRSTPRGRLIVGMDGLFGRTEDLRNRPIPELAPVSRDLFEAVYALTLSDMVRIEGKAWDTIQDRLLGGLNIEQLRNPRDVATEIEKEAKKLWRADRRGKVRSAELREQIRSIRSQVRDARERDLKARRLTEEIGEMSARKTDLETQLQDDRAAIRTTDRLIPVRRGLQQITSLEEAAGDMSAFGEIPAEPSSALRRLRADKGRLTSEFEARRAALGRLESAVEAFDDGARETVRHGSEIRSLQSRSAIIAEWRAQLDDLHVRLDERRSVFEEKWSRVMPCELDPMQQRNAISFPVAEMRSRLAALKSLEDRRTQAADGQDQQEGSSMMVRWAMVSLLGLIVAVVGVLISQPIVWGLALAFASGAAALLWQGVVSRRKNARRDYGGLAGLIADLDLEIEDARAWTKERLLLLGVDPDIERERVADLVKGLEELQVIAERLADDEAAASRLTGSLSREEDRIASVARLLGISLSLPAERQVRLMADALELAESRRVAATHASEQIDAEADAVLELQKRLNEVSKELVRLESTLREVGEGDPEKGSLVLEERRSLIRRATSIREDLENRYPDLPAITEEISSLNGAVALDDRARVQLDSRIEDARAAIVSLVEGIAEREARLAALRGLPTVADLESEAEVLEGEVRGAEEERDRLMLLANLIREADESFREKHQPDVVRRASAMLAALTGGKYNRLELAEDNDGRLMAHDAQQGRVVTVGPPLSRGTLDQIYLTLRIAIAEHLDDPGDPLPLFLDEILVNWDEGRRKRGFQLLADIAESRQVFFFTCHDWMAGEIERSAGGHVVRL